MKVSIDYYCLPGDLKGRVIVKNVHTYEKLEDIYVDLLNTTVKEVVEEMKAKYPNFELREFKY